MLTPKDLRALADRLATMTGTGAFITKDRVELYAEALKALAEKRERERTAQLSPLPSRSISSR